MIISVPASSANMGPGFDTLGLALDVPFLCRLGPGKDRRVEAETHPTVVAFRSFGGVGPVSIKTSIPSGRGLGFSGAARVAGLVAACVQQHGPRLDLSAHLSRVFAQAADMEGHGDNVAASIYGGCVAAAGRRVVSVPMPLEPAIVVWIPSSQTSTSTSRKALAPLVSRDDAVFNVARTAILVAALAGGDIAALRDATQDRLHQDVRFRLAPQCRVALLSMLQAGAWSAWLSGSGPTVAAMCAPHDAARIMAALPPGGRAHVLEIDRVGVKLLPATADVSSENRQPLGW